MQEANQSPAIQEFYRKEVEWQYRLDSSNLLYERCESAWLRGFISSFTKCNDDPKALERHMDYAKKCAERFADLEVIIQWIIWLYGEPSEELALRIRKVTDETQIEQIRSILSMEHVKTMEDFENELRKIL